MVSSKILFATVWSFCLCSVGISVFVSMHPSIPSYVLGGNPNYDLENDNYGMNCGQFKDDLDILRQFPFPIRVNPKDSEHDLDLVQLNTDNKTVRMMLIHHEKILPTSVFCLSRIKDLTLNGVEFKDGVLPEGLKTMQTLDELSISNVPNLKIGDHFSKMPKLTTLVFENCGLTTFPDVTHLKMIALFLDNNQLTHLNGPIDTCMLSIENNNFQTLPILKNPEVLVSLSASNNPITSMASVMTYKNLRTLSLSQTNVSFVPSTIDHLQDLEFLELSDTKITRLPTTILNLPKLEYLNIKNTLLSSMDIDAIRKALKISHPDLTFEV